MLVFVFFLCAAFGEIKVFITTSAGGEIKK